MKRVHVVRDDESTTIWVDEEDSNHPGIVQEIPDALWTRYVEARDRWFVVQRALELQFAEAMDVQDQFWRPEL